MASKKSSSSRKTSGKKTSGKKSSGSKKQTSEFSVKSEVLLLLILAIAIVIFICNLGKAGIVGAYISTFCFGAFGMIAYAFPVWLFFVAAFLTANQKYQGKVIMKTIAGVILLVFLCVFAHLIAHGVTETKLFDLVKLSVENKNGGGLLGAGFGLLLTNGLGLVCSYVIAVVAIIIGVVLLTEKSFFGGLKKGSTKVYETARDDAKKRKEHSAERARIREERRLQEELYAEEAGKDRRKINTEPDIRRIDKKVSGVALDTTIVGSVDKAAKSGAGDMVEITAPAAGVTITSIHNNPSDDITERQSEEFWDRQNQMQTGAKKAEPVIHGAADDVDEMKASGEKEKTVHKNKKQSQNDIQTGIDDVAREIEKTDPQDSYYTFPPVSLLAKGNPNATGDSRQHLQEMSNKLQMTLDNFGVKAHVTNVTCGPSVTQYEIQPEMGVKVSKIVSLADDIKLNLAVPDIRMEAPIPGKAAIGIEVPNKENVTVAFRDLIESKEFQGSGSKIAFAAGKDISGNVIIADIAKMPHLLIAGATGSGKSVCINTIIMSILYKADPEDVKLIMIDPKVVELSVYNGIPHLLIPVVTDPKKAAGALHWAVAEMTDRYQKFAEYNVRDLKGYNKKVESVSDINDPDKPKKLPQIVIIVDELADLMMVAPGDVEDAICRLAQLARACGIHLVIATQRPSVNVITGLIKANMPSRIAFSVTSGVDSRTILDMNGAEKLLGKGDMLFYPQGFQKPLRVQGAFVSDKEVSDVVDFLTENNYQVTYDKEIEDKMKSAVNSSMGGGSGFASGGDDRDTYFVEAGRFVIEKEKGSIGMLQRMFKVGFNRAARIMDQLEEAGVVGPEEGTKPRKVLMSMEAFEQYVDEYV
ncbi:MAG: DNA translocase FtsK 4TM domain-containing protein [Eubacterium sp.]|nr:DNA translocase FtsK 4TM domain-containing protein [Eubacterium sp.]